MINSERWLKNTSSVPFNDAMNAFFKHIKKPFWLDPKNEDTEKLGALLNPSSPELFDVYPVSRRVNNPINNDSELLKEISD